MRRVLAVVLIFILCFCFVVCGKDNIKERNEQAKEVLMKVLEKEQAFTAKTGVFLTQLLNKYWKNIIFKPLIMLIILSFRNSMHLLILTTTI